MMIGSGMLTTTLLVLCACFLLHALSTKDKKFTSYVKALQSYKKLHGDLLVPSKYIVPGDSSDYPDECWNMNLGVLVQSTRAAKSFSDLKYASLLDQIGFCWHADGFRRKKNFDCLLKVIDDNGLVGEELNKLAFDAKISMISIQEDGKEKKKKYRVSLGRKLHEIRQGLIFNEKHYHEALRKRGFEFDDFVAVSNEDSLLLSVDETIKGKDKLSLLHVAKATRRRDRTQFQKIYLALVKYKEIYQHLAIPTEFIIPAEDGEVDFELWGNANSELAGLPLGRICSRIRCGSSYSDLSFTILLDKIDFVWSLREYKKKEKEDKRENKVNE